jgi:hypothetical protein
VTDQMQTKAATDVLAATSFLKPALGKITANLELLLGKPVSITTSDPVTVARAEVLGRIPARLDRAALLQRLLRRGRPIPAPHGPATPATNSP